MLHGASWCFAAGHLAEPLDSALEARRALRSEFANVAKLSTKKKKTTTTATTGTTGREVIVNIHNSSQLCEPCDPLSLDSTIFYKYTQSLTLQPLVAPISHGSGWRPRVRRPVNSAHFKWPAGGVQLNALTSFKDHPRISAYSLQP